MKVLHCLSSGLTSYIASRSIVAWSFFLIGDNCVFYDLTLFESSKCIQYETIYVGGAAPFLITRRIVLPVHALKVVKNNFREFCLYRRQTIYFLSYYSLIPNVQFAHASNSFPPTSLNIYPFSYCPNNTFPYYILTIPDNNAHSNKYTNVSSQLYNLSFHPSFPSLLFSPARILSQTLSLYSSHHKPLIQTLNHTHTHSTKITTIPKHKHNTRASHLPLIPPLSPPRRQARSPPEIDYPHFPGLEFGDKLAIPDLDLGEVRLFSLLLPCWDGRG